MALISLRQLLDHAAENNYGLPAFNVNNMEQVKAIMEAAAAVDSPVILQGSAGARSYAGEPFLRHLILAAIEMYPQIPICMHQDHGASPAICFRSIHCRPKPLRGSTRSKRCKRWTACASKRKKKPSRVLAARVSITAIYVVTRRLRCRWSLLRCI